MNIDRNKIIERLQVARDKVAKRWTQHIYARDAEGAPCHRYSEDAVSFCMIGALDSAFGQTSPFKTPASKLIGEFALNLAVNRNVDKPVINWNDEPGRTQEEVVTAFDRGVELLRTMPDDEFEALYQKAKGGSSDDQVV